MFVRSATRGCTAAAHSCSKTGVQRLRRPRARAVCSALLRLLVKDAAPAGALVQDRGLDDHLEREDCGDEAADDCKYAGGLQLAADELACEESLCLALLRERDRARREEGKQELFDVAQRASADRGVAEEVDLRAARHDEGLDPRQEAEHDGDDEEHQDYDLHEDDDGPEAEVRVGAAPQAAVAADAADAATVAEALGALVPLLV
mmetsp:Transcript_2067/g.5546  ORF Transcript_2067/g.5546 Transcript_2067/m.5546 type:complete len:205 (+) Transcript_2067:43-657(+)